MVKGNRMITFNESFNKSWITEMPMGISPLSTGLFNSIVKSAKEYEHAGIQQESLDNGYYRIQGTQVAFYWHETNAIIDIIVELGIRPQSLVVHQIAKNPESTTTSYATELYKEIIKINNNSLVLSDEYLSNDGLNTWKRLVNSGCTVSVYDKENPDQGLISLKTQTELMLFFGDKDSTKKRYQYVLSESLIKLSDVTTLFNTVRLRKLAGYPDI